MDIRGKFTRAELAMAHHEAAHAVTGEFLVPGCVEAVTLDGRCPGRHEESPYGCRAMTSFTNYLTRMTDPENTAVVILAGMYGWSLVTTDGYLSSSKGDRWQVDQLRLGRRQRKRAQKKAKALVLEYRDHVQRLSDALLERRLMTGPEVRELLRG